MLREKLQSLHATIERNGFQSDYAAGTKEMYQYATELTRTIDRTKKMMFQSFKSASDRITELQARIKMQNEMSELKEMEKLRHGVKVAESNVSQAPAAIDGEMLQDMYSQASAAESHRTSNFQKVSYEAHRAETEMKYTVGRIVEKFEGLEPLFVLTPS